MSTPTRAVVAMVICRDALNHHAIEPCSQSLVIADAVLALFAASPPEQQTPQPNEDTP